MGLGFLGALAGGYQAIQRGIDLDQQRRNAEEDRQYTLEQRANARQDRAFGLGQQQRLLADQQRQDQLRKDLQAVPATREVDARPQALREITHDDTTGPDDNTPSAAAMPVMKTVDAPRWMQLQGRAEAFRKSGEIEKADAYDEVARREQFAEGGRRTAQLRSGAGQMSLEQLAQAARDIYNNDPLPAQVSNIKSGPNGVDLTITNPTTGRTEVLSVKDKAALLDKLESYYSPDTYAAAMAEQRQAAMKTQAKLSEPLVLAPGQKAVIPLTGATVANNERPTSAEVRAAGGTGAGTGAGGKADDPEKALNGLWETVSTKGESKLLPPQLAQGRRILGDLVRGDGRQPGLEPNLAAEIALDVATDPTKSRLEINKITGDIDQIYQNPRVNRGAPIVISRGAGTLEELEKIAKESKNPGMLKTAAEDLVRHLNAPLPPELQQAGRDHLLKVAADPAMRKAYLQTVKEMGRDVGAAERQLSIIGKYLQPSAPGANDDKNGSGPLSRLGRGLGLGVERPPEQVPPDSPAGKYQARQSALRQKQAAAEAEAASRAEALGAQFRADAKTMDPISLSQKYDSLRRSLPTKDAAALQQIERQIR